MVRSIHDKHHCEKVSSTHVQKRVNVERTVEEGFKRVLNATTYYKDSIDKSWGIRPTGGQLWQQ